jgi:hypothetical protein
MEIRPEMSNAELKAIRAQARVEAGVTGAAVYAYHKTGVILCGTTSVDRRMSASGRGILPLKNTARLSPAPKNRDVIYAFGEERVSSCLQSRADAWIPFGLSRVGWSPIAGFPSP